MSKDITQRGWHRLKADFVRYARILPEPDVRFVVSLPQDADPRAVDVVVVDELGANEAKHLDEQCNVLLRQDDWTPGPVGGLRASYETNPDAHEVLQNLVDDSRDEEQLPCGCPRSLPAFTNPPDADGLVCKRHDEEMDPESVREVLH